MELAVAAAWCALGKLTTEKALAVADAALTQGLYSDALGKVIFATPQWSDVGPLFERALVELGVVCLTGPPRFRGSPANLL
jgi:hypothetical protein